MALLLQEQIPRRQWLVFVPPAGTSSDQPSLDPPAEETGFAVAHQTAHRQRRILIVDDEAEMLFMTKLFLEQAFPGLHIDTAETGPDALQLMEGQAYDAVVSDYRMPKMDGLEFLAKAATRVPSDRRILMTAFADKTLQQRARQAGLAFIEKAGDPKSIVEAVGRALKL
ncbi:MAG TPA: response regulator [Candidatus Thermoplasmatota archaeon]|nr:response regulator [Candidatus Thermoplasmatota archaeon]